MNSSGIIANHSFKEMHREVIEGIMSSSVSGLVLLETKGDIDGIVIEIYRESCRLLIVTGSHSKLYNIGYHY